MFFVRGILAWFVLMVLMFVNGAVRELVTGVLAGRRAAELIHVATGCLLVLAVALWFVHREGGARPARLVGLGCVWVLMTVVFEALLVLAGGQPFSQVIDSYDLTRGVLWPIVVLTVLLAPTLGGLIDWRLRERHRQ